MAQTDQLKAIIIHATKFGIVGGVVLALQSVLFWALFVGAHLAPLLSGALASAIAMFVNFLLTSHYTWRDSRPTAIQSPLWRMGRYFTAIGIGYVVYVAVFQGMLVLDVPPFWGNVVGALAGGGSNFILHSVWTFRP